MAVMENKDISIGSINCTVIENESTDESTLVKGNHVGPDGIELNYFDLLDETPEFSEAAILLADDVIEYCYVKNGKDGRQYFGFDRCLPGTDEYNQIIARHNLINKMEANTFERYPSGKTVLSRRGKILEVSSVRQGGMYV